VQVRKSHRDQLTRIVEHAILEVREAFTDSEPAIANHVLYGTMGNHPGHLAILVTFADEAALGRARQDGLCERIRQTLVRTLAREGYPVEHLSADQVTFVSKEEIEVGRGPWPLFR